MIWVRKFLVSLFSVIALAALVGSVLSFSLNRAFATPDHLEQWLDQSKLYEHFVATSVGQATQAGDEQTNRTAINLSSDDSTVQQAVQTAFPKQLINQSVMDFLNANYGWLQGKTTTPDFQIDLTAAKTQFGQEVGKAVADHLKSLPECTPAQMTAMQSVDLLHVSCRPAGVDPNLEAAQVQQQIADNGGLLGNPVLTPESLTQQKDGSQPYYKQLSMLPTAYRIAQKMPYILGAVSLLSLLIIFLAASTRRGAWRLVAKILIVAGLILVIGKLALDVIFKRVQDHLFNNTTNGQLQQSLTDFAHRAAAYTTHLTFIGGLVYIGVGALIVIGLLLRRQQGRTSATSRFGVPEVAAAPVEPSATKTVPTQRGRRVMDVAGPSPVNAAQTTSKPAVSSAPTLPGAKPKGLGRKGIIQ